MTLYITAYVIGLIFATYHYGTRTDFKGTEDVWRVGLMAVFWPVPLLGEVARWWGRRVG